MNWTMMCQLMPQLSQTVADRMQWALGMEDLRKSTENILRWPQQQLVDREVHISLRR